MFSRIVVAEPERELVGLSQPRIALERLVKQIRDDREIDREERHQGAAAADVLHQNALRATPGSSLHRAS